MRYTNVSLLSLVSIPASSVVILAFFMSWVTVSVSSCSYSGPIEVSGYELATGKYPPELGTQPPQLGQEVPTAPYALAVPFLSLFVLVLAVTYALTNRGGSLLAIMNIMTGFIGIVVDAIIFANFKSFINRNPDIQVQIEYKWPLVLSIGSYIAMIIIGIFSPRRREPPRGVTILRPQEPQPLLQGRRYPKLPSGSGSVGKRPKWANKRK